VNCTDPAAPSFAFPGVSIRARFTGTGIDMILSDHGSSSSPNFYTVIIDECTPERLEMTPGEHTYSLARGLAEGEHTVEVFKGNESNFGNGEAEFLGFRIDSGAMLMDLAPRPGRIEFVGDSITCGYGSEVSAINPENDPSTSENANEYNAWGAITARALNAELMVVCYSGRGAYRNDNDSAGAVLPEMYLYTHPDAGDTGHWDTSKFTPDVAVVNLGTADFSPGIDVSELDALREAYESANHRRRTPVNHRRRNSVDSPNRVHRVWASFGFLTESSSFQARRPWSSSPSGFTSAASFSETACGLLPLFSRASCAGLLLETGSPADSAGGSEG
jgi:hypothetical protein